jgi:hypothetical protein
MRCRTNVELAERHGYRKQDLDVKPGFLRVQQRYLALDQAALLEVADAPPGRRARHARDLGKIGLRAGRVLLQGIEQAFVGTRQFHLDTLPLFQSFMNALFLFINYIGHIRTHRAHKSRKMSGLPV